MSNETIIVGKHTLESLTIGMYSDPFTIYREYVQNSTDSIDAAISRGIISAQKGRIDIIVSQDSDSIEIIDNGIGINAEESYKILCDIGNSTKDHTTNRGFRGIGRLGGLGYADKLIFETSAKNEGNKTIVIWDCIKLKEMLQPGKYQDYDILKVISECTTFKKIKEDPELHYFSVKLEGISREFTELLSIESVDYYLSTVAPVPFDCQKFIFANQIKAYYNKKGKIIDEYNLYLNKSPVPVLKRYKSNFKTGQQERTNQNDHIFDIEYFEGSQNGEIIYIGWIGLCEFKGTIQDDYMRGIRIRKGNILVGDEQTFGQFFSSEQNRANGVFVGEVHIFWNEIIPNARRDNFEKVGEYKYLESILKEKADELNKKYRRGFSQINSAIKKYADGIEKIKEIKNELNDGISSDVHREKLINDKREVETIIENALTEITKLKSKNDVAKNKSEYIDTIIKQHSSKRKEIIDLENQIIEKDFKGKDQLSFLSKEQRRVYKIIIEVIDKELDKDIAKYLNEEIIHALKHRDKRK